MATHDQSWKFYLSPAETWAAIYEDCAAATQSIKIEQYIFENDAIGQKFIALFTEKAAAGVKVRLLCDEVGSYSFAGSPLIDKFRQNGGTFHFYNSPRLIDIFKPRRFFPRTHVKATVIDSKIAYIGGVCFAERMKDWRDTQIRITGPVVAQIEKALDGNFAEIGHKKHHGKRRINPNPPENGFAYVQNDPGFLRHPIYRLLLDHIASGKKHIYISMAYLVPTRRLRRRLAQAVSRNVEVILLVPEYSDFWIADWAFLSYAPRMLKHGIRIFYYPHTVLHNKTAVIDDKWGTVGSCNMDPLSFFHNRESNLIITNESALVEMEQTFHHDIERSRELTKAGYKKIALWKRVVAHLARLMRPVL